MTETGNAHGPDFLVIGAQRSGTSWLYVLLRQHPGLWVAPVKELHYFDRPEVGRTVTDWKELRRAILSPMFPPRPWHLPYLLGRRDDRWYANLFRNAQAKGLVAGEITPAYATLDDAGLRRIHAMNNRVKLIFIMRDPVQRAWSAISNNFKKGKANGAMTVDAALAMTRERGPMQRAAYSDTISRLEGIFRRDQLHFCFFDDLRDRPEAFANDLLAFLGIEPGDIGATLPAGAVNVAAGGGPVPAAFEREMAKSYLSEVEALCRRFDGPPQQWRARYGRLLDNAAG